MLFNSIEFIFILLPLSLLLFYILGGKGYYQKAIFSLVLVSLFFYAWWNPSYLILLMISISFNYFIGYILSQENRQKEQKKLILTFGIVINLALLSYFKYANFFIDQFDKIIGTSFNLNPSQNQL